MVGFSSRAEDAGITIVNEVGLDPGIDHLLAMECFDEIKLNGGKVRLFALSFSFLISIIIWVAKLSPAWKNPG